MAILTDKSEYINWRTSVRIRPKYKYTTTFQSLHKDKPFFNFVEVGNKTKQASHRQLFAYYWKYYLNIEHSTVKPDSIHQVILSESTKPIIAKAPIDVSFINPNDIDALLSIQGKPILNRMVKLIQDTAHEENWPLEKINIRHTRDFEVKYWEYIVIILVFNCTFETANTYLEDIYKRLDPLVVKLDSQARELIAKFIYLDIETTKNVQSS